MLNNIQLTRLYGFVALAIVTCGCCLPLPATGGEFMGILKKEPAYPFSGFSCQLFFKGEPAAHAKVIRSYELASKNEKHEEFAVADAQGRFSFDSIVVQYRTPVLGPVEFLSRQRVFVEYQGEEYPIWVGAKFDKGEYAEFGEKFRKLRCELTEDIRRIDVKKSYYGTSCHWNDN